MCGPCCWDLLLSWPIPLLWLKKVEVEQWRFVFRSPAVDASASTTSLKAQQDLCRMKIYQTILKILFHETILVISKAILTPPPQLYICVNLHLTNHFLMKCLIPSTALQSTIAFWNSLFCMRGLRQRHQGGSPRSPMLWIFESRLGLRHSDSRYSLHFISLGFCINRSCGSLSGSLHSSASCFSRPSRPLLFLQFWLLLSILKLAPLLLVWMSAACSNSCLA